MRLIQGRPQREYEKVAVDEWLTGTIDDVQYEAERAYSIKNKETGEWEEATAPHVRFKFKMDGYQYPHYSRWMRASTNEKSNLYSKYLRHLCPEVDCMDKDIDLDRLIGAKVKVMWENNGDFQNVSQIRGLNPSLDLVIEHDGGGDASSP